MKIRRMTCEDEYDFARQEYMLPLFREEIGYSRAIIDFDDHSILFLSWILGSSYHKSTKHSMPNSIYEYDICKDKYENYEDFRYILMKIKKLKWKLGWVISK
jgi:hypothetical protein